VLGAGKGEILKRFLAGLVCLLGAATASAQIVWPNGALAEYRIEVAKEALPVCAVRFFSGGLLTTGAQNIRVTDSKGTALPIQIVYTHPLNASLVLFPLLPGEETYRLFFGGTVTPGAAVTNFGRGLFYETRARPDGDASSWSAMQKLWTNATNSLGIAVLGDTTTRCNPFDESDNHFMSRTAGAWQTPREDVYKLGIFAKEQGFLSINGQPVASTAFDPAARTQNIGDALVPAGVQQLEILQAKRTGEGVTGVSWLTPWPEYFGGNLTARPILPAWHPGVATSVARDYEVRGQPVSACFNDFQTDMLLAADQPIILVSFHNRTRGQTTYQWDFGDGTTSTEANPQHVYVKPGRYVVTLMAGGTSRFSKIVLATSFSAVPAQKIPMFESTNPWAAAEMIRLATPDLNKYDPGTLWTLLALAEKIDDRKARAEAILKIGPLYLTKSGDLTRQAEIPVREKLANAKADLGQWDAAVAELQQLETKLDKQRTLQTKLRLQIGRLYQRAGKNPQALLVYTQIVADKGGDDPKLERTAQIALGNTYLQQGDIGAARKAFEQASQSEVSDGRTERERAIRRGSLYTTLRQTIAEITKLTLDAPGDPDENRESVTPLIERAQTSFDSLVFEFPDVRLNPDVVYLNATFQLAVGDEEECLAELKTLAKAEPTGRYTLRSMLLQARVNMRDKEYTKALALLEAVLKSTKEEPVIKEATTLKSKATDAKASLVRFTDATKHYWPANLAALATNTVAWSTPGDCKITFEDDAKRRLRIELLKPVTPPAYLTIRFPTAIGDRLFARCRILCTDADIRWSEVRRSSTQSDSLYTRLGSVPLALQQWGWREPIFNAEPWRQFSWRTGPITEGESTGAISFIALARPGRTVIPAGTLIYVDSVECYLAP